MRRRTRPHRWLLALALAASGCGASLRGWLPQYRLAEPRRQVGAPRWLAEFTTDELFGRLDPAGRRLAYAGAQKGSLDIWIKDLASGQPRRVTRHVATDTQPSWSPDGKVLAFVSMRDDVKGDVYLWTGGRSFTRLSGRRTADSFPVFAADGRSVFYAAGPEGQSRIVRRDLGGDDAPRPVTGWGATHPAVSPGGHYLAYTRFGVERIGQIVVRSLASGREWVVTTAEQHAGFPCFSPDGKRLYFSRFMRGPPKTALGAGAVASLWWVPLARARAARGPAAAQRSARPLTDDGRTTIFAQAHDKGIVFTAPRQGSLDVGLMPAAGLVPRLTSVADQRALAEAQDDPWRELLCLERVWSRGDAGRAASEARYRATVLWRRLGELDEAEAMLRRLAAGVEDGAGADREVAALAAIDLALLAVERARRTAKARGRRARLAALASQILARLRGRPSSATPRVAAYRLLRIADLQRLAGRRRAAIASYERLLGRHADQRALGAEALLRLGELFAAVREPSLLASYYLTLFDRFPRQRRWLDRAVDAVFALYERLEPARQVEVLRRLIDRHGDKPRFCARAQRRIGRLYERAGQLPLAIEAMYEVTRRHGKRNTLRSTVTAAAFDLGRLSLAYSEQLRRQKRLGEALTFYAKARRAYRQVVARHEPAHEAHQRARAEFVRLSLLEATQLERDGERTLAEKRYRELVAFDPDVLQAHRRLIALGVAGGRRARLAARYRRRIDRGGVTDLVVGHYGLGFLATFATPLDDDALDEAAKHLSRAVALRPQSPFVHMTLGWVQEMRERALGEARKGWLEEAIVSYERAYALNDGAVDRKTEGDLLVNLCNAFANLGNGWELAYDYCAKRQRLKLPFLSAKREAYHRLVFGRAAAATGHHRVAARQLDQALALARRLGYRRLEAQVIARKAFSAALRGEHREAIGLFGRTIALLEKRGQTAQLAALTRAVAQSQLALGDRRAAERSLARAAELLGRHGTPPQGGWGKAGGAFGSSVSPLGFDGADERNAQRAFSGLIFRARGDWRPLRAALVARIKNREQAASDRGDEELSREALLLRNQLALVERRLGAVGAAVSELERAYELTVTAQTVGGKLEPDGALFALQVALGLNLAEGVLGRPGVPSTDELVRRHEQLAAVERLRAEHVAREGKPLLPLRLRLALWGDLGALSLARGLSEVGQGGKGPASKASEPKEAKGAAGAVAHAALSRLGRRGALLVRAVSLFRRIELATRPAELATTVPGAGASAAARPPAPPPAAASAASATGATRGEAPAPNEHGAMQPVWRPLSPIERLRWHVRAGLNLAATATLFVPEAKLADHPSTELLVQLADLCLRYDLGALRFVVAAELALRRRDRRAMDAAVDGFLARSPFALGDADRRGAAGLRHQVFSRAIRLALGEGRVGAALGFAERAERRAFVDELVALGPAGTGRLAAPVAALVAAGRSYARLLERQDPAALPEAGAGWQKAIDRARRRVDDAQRALTGKDARVASLLTVGAFDHRQLGRALQPGDLLVSAIEAGQRRLLVSLGPGEAAELRATPLSLSSAALGTPAGQRRLRAAVEKLARGAHARRLYLDLGRLGVWPSGWRLGDRELVLLSGCWQLLDARAVRRPPRPGGLVVEPKPARAKAIAAAAGLAVLGGERGGALERRLEEVGLLVWSAARFGGGSAANIRLPLPPAAAGARPSKGEGEPGPARLELGRLLGLRLRGQLLLLGEILHTPGRERAERIALGRLLHAAGIPAYIVAARGGLARAKLGGLAAAFAAGRPSTAARRRGLALRGDGGLDPTRARELARVAVRAELEAGTAALAKRRLAAAVESLQHALAAIALVGELKDERERALDALARAYTFQQDYGRAVVWMQRLLDLRRARIARARKAGAARPLLLAQASWVKALMSMGWIRLRNDQFDEALAVNAKAIALYAEVKRPLMAGSAHEQRRIIAEKKGDAKEALAAARAALRVAETLLARAKGASRPPLQLGVADAARRVARLLRMRFSDYRRAMRRARQALDQIGWADPARLKALLSGYGATRKELGAAKTVAERKRLKGKLAAILGEGKRQRAALIARVETLLEVARIHGARGDYGGAVKQAERAGALAATARLSAQIPVAKLEEVNNLYYMGAYQRALRAAEAALRQAKKVSDRLRQIQFYNVKGTILSALGKPKPALRSLSAALRIAERLDRPGEVAASHNNIGDALRRAGRLLEAHERFTRALAIDRQREDKLGMSFDYANIGLTERLLGRKGEAKRHLLRAVALSRELGAPQGELKARIGLGRLALDGGDRPEARRQLAGGLKLSRKLGLRNWLWRFLLWSGRVARGSGDRATARRLLREAVAIVEAQPPRLRPAIGARQVDAQPEEAFDELIDLLAEAGEARASFDLLERLRARSFVDLVSRSVRTLDVPGKAELATLAAGAVALEAARTERMRAAPGSVDRRAAEAEIVRLDAQLATARAALRPGLAGLVRGDAWPHARLVDRLRAHPGVTFVSYYPGRRRLLAWVLRGDRITLRPVALDRRRLRAAVAELRRRLVRFHPPAGAARRLHDALIAKVLPDGVPERLVVIPAGALHLVPFAALHDGRDYLVARTTLSQLSSLNALRSTAPASQPIAAKSAVSLSRVEAPAGGGGLVRMPFVAHEAAAFGRAFPGARLYRGQQADAAELLRSAPTARLLHIATHGGVRSEAPLRSYLSLADGPFDLRRVFGVSLSAELVVLSGCETGRGPLAGADGVLGLHAAFLRAGARRVVSSLWRVSDLGTALLMKHLFRRLAAGDPPALALRQAQRTVRRRFPHPAFWAGFRLDGAL